MHLLRRRFRPGLECLEDRALPSTSRLPLLDRLPPSAPATQFKLLAPEHAIAGKPINVAVVALTANNLPAYSFVGTVQLTSDDTAAKLPTDPYTFTRRDFGTHRFELTLNTVGSQTLTVSTVTDDPAAALTTTATIEVKAAPVATQFRVTMPEYVKAGREVPVNVIALTADGRPVPNYVGTVHLTSSDTAAGLPADYTFTPQDRGRHTFRVTMQTNGAQSVTVADASDDTLVGSAKTTVEAAPVATQFRLQLPEHVKAGAPVPLTVIALTADGRPVRNYTGTVQFTSTDAAAGLPADYTFTASDNGRHTFRVTMQTAGAQGITVTDTTNAALTAEIHTTVAPAPTATRFLVAVLPPVRAGAVAQVLVTALDERNRPVLNYTGTVKFTSSDTSAVLPAEYTFTADDHGTHRFDVTFLALGQQTLTVTDTTNDKLTGIASFNVRDNTRPKPRSPIDILVDVLNGLKRP